ncbi:PACE efflux transporter [Paenalcaligenes faecalis]|uniref:PACE efflux transporter n=1 Tax=Paenalcaligenes faecalis TaxID=2980099 RepID=UPI0022B970BC|nr:PACE efflux transporter [Paenalcaligenes faecalis]
MITLSPLKRRLVYVTVFEIFAILFSTLILMGLSGSDAQDSLPVAIIVSVTAVIWNYVYNTLFESWERRHQIMDRTLRIRCFHAIGFEGGLLVFCLPIYMLWYGVGLWTAFVMEAALLLFFLVYTFVFTLIFDKIFTLHHQNPYADA